MFKEKHIPDNIVVESEKFIQGNQADLGKQFMTNQVGEKHKEDVEDGRKETAKKSLSDREISNKFKKKS
jgi:hypothetical protein